MGDGRAQNLSARDSGFPDNYDLRRMLHLQDPAGPGVLPMPCVGPPAFHRHRPRWHRTWARSRGPHNPAVEDGDQQQLVRILPGRVFLFGRCRRVQDGLQPESALLDGPPPPEALHQRQRPLLLQIDAPALLQIDAPAPQRGLAVSERVAVGDLPVDLAAQRGRRPLKYAQRGQHGPLYYRRHRPTLPLPHPFFLRTWGMYAVRTSMDLDGGAPEQANLGAPATVGLVLAQCLGSGHRVRCQLRVFNNKLSRR